MRWSTTLLLGLAAACASESPEFGANEPGVAAQQRAEELKASGHAGSAAREFEEAARQAGEAGDGVHQVHALFDAAEAWLLDGRPSVARIDVDKAERVVPHLPVDGSKRRVAELRLALARGDLALVGGRYDEARAQYDQALGRAVGSERDLVAIRQSVLAERRGDPQKARWYAGQLADPRSPRIAELRAMLHATSPPPAAASTPAPKTSYVPKAVAPIPSPTAPAPAVLPRSAWGARRMHANLDRMTGIYRITVHHTATRLPSNNPRAAADAIRHFQQQHQDEKGWADIGYHFIIDPSGRIWEGRPLRWQGAHAGTPELNVGNIGVALIGDFTVQQPTASQRRALGELLDSLCARYRIDRSHVYTHQEIRPDPTECPGPALQRVVAQWRATLNPSY